MITNEQIRQAISDCKKLGYNIRVRDISYVLLCQQMEDRSAVYKILFGQDADFNEEYAYTYDQTAAITYLRSYADFNFQSQGSRKKDLMDDDISFEENKAEIIKLIEETRKARKAGDIKVSDALKIESDLRVKLNDKFKVTEENQEQLVVVNTKFNAICGTCGHEIYIPTKEDLMKKYNLVEKEN